MPPSLWSRHPRYIVLVGFIVCATFYLLTTDVASFPPPSYTSHSNVYEVTLKDQGLPGRVARADKIYNKFLKDRQGLIKKFGPSPNDILMFPPNRDPWLPYTVWDFFLPAFNCPHEVERIGALGDGGKWVCGLSRLETKKDCVIYSFGINYESSFEAGLLENTNHCEVWGYDFSVKSFGPEIPQYLRSRTHFFPYGLGGGDRFSDDGQYPLYTLDTVMNLNKHQHIDILKIDIESWEFETLKTLVDQYLASGKPLPFGQLQLEVHIWNKSFAEFLQWWEKLEQAGLRPFWTEPNIVYQNYNEHVDLAEFSFINTRGDNIFISDPAPSKEGAPAAAADGFAGAAIQKDHH